MGSSITDPYFSTFHCELTMNDANGNAVLRVTGYGTNADAAFQDARKKVQEMNLKFMAEEDKRV